MSVARVVPAQPVVFYGCVIIAITICVISYGPAPACADMSQTPQKRKVSDTDIVNNIASVDPDVVPRPPKLEKFLEPLMNKSCGDLCNNTADRKVLDSTVEQTTEELTLPICRKCRELVKDHLARMTSAVSELHYSYHDTHPRPTKKAKSDPQGDPDLFSWFRDQAQLWSEGIMYDFPPLVDPDRLDSDEGAPNVSGHVQRNGDEAGGTSENEAPRGADGILSDMLERDGTIGKSETIDSAIIKKLMDTNKLKAGTEEAHLVPKSLTLHVKDCKDTQEHATAVNLLLNIHHALYKEKRDNLEKKLKGEDCGRVVPFFNHDDFIRYWPAPAIVNFLDQISNSRYVVALDNCRKTIEEYRVPLAASLNSTCSGGFKSSYGKGDVANVTEGGRPLLKNMPQYLRDLADGRGNEGGAWAYNPNNKNDEGLNMLSAPFIVHRMGMDGIGNEVFGPALMLGWAVQCGPSGGSPAQSQGPGKVSNRGYVEGYPLVRGEQLFKPSLSDDQCIVQAYGSRWRGAILGAIGRDGEWMMRRSMALMTEGQINLKRTKLKHKPVPQDKFDKEVNGLIQKLLQCNDDECRHQQYKFINDKYEARYEELQSLFRAWMFAGNLEVTVNKTLRKRAGHCWSKNDQKLEKEEHFFSVERASNESGGLTDWPEDFKDAFQRAAGLLDETNHCDKWFKLPPGDRLLSS